MPNKAPQRRRRRKLLKGAVQLALTLGTLANATLISADVSDTVDEKAFILSTECVYTLRDGTAGEGPIIFGWAHADYTDAEIEAWIENQGSWSEGNLVSQEISKRKIRMVGQFDNVSGTSGGDEKFREGQMVKTSLKFVLETGVALSLWAYNLSGGALTTGSVLLATGHAWIAPS